MKPKSLNRFLALCAPLALLSLSSNGSAATWTGTADADWNNPANWGGTAPVSNDPLVFTSATGAGGLTLSDNLMTPGTFNVAGITFNAGSGAYVINPAAGTNGFTLTGNITNNSTSTQTINDLIAISGTRFISATAGNITLGGTVSGTGLITKAGGSVLTLTGTNSSHSGGITVNAGTLALGNDSAAGTGTLIVGSGALAGTTIQSADSNTRTIGNALAFGTHATLGSATTGDLLFTGTLNTGGGAKNITINNAVTEFSGAITGTTGTTDTKLGTGKLILSGNNLATFDKAISVSAGTLNIRNSGALGTITRGTTVSSGAALELEHATGIAVGAEALSLSGTGISNGGAMRNISGANSYAGVVTLAADSRINSDAGSLTLSAGVTGATRNLTVGGAGNTSISAITTTTGTLTKDGAGTLTLTGTSSYTGATNVDNGKLVVNGNISTSILTTVNTGGMIGGSGTLGALTVALGGTLSPGNSIGTLTTGNLTLGDGSFSAFEINTAGDISDLASASLNLHFDGTLNVSNIGGTLANGDVFNLFDWNTTDGSTFDAVNLPSLDPGLTWDQSNLYTLGQIGVVPVPEPAAALLGGLGLLALLRRRRA